MEDAEASRRPVKTAAGAVPVDETWQGKSYQERFAIFCERLMAENLYDGVCYITSPSRRNRSKALTGDISLRRSTHC